MEVIRESLIEQGLSASEVVQRSFYGWEFEVEYQAARFLVVLQFIDHWLLICDLKRSLLDRILFRDRTAAHEHVLKAIDRTLQSDSRFRGIAWLTQEQYASGANSAS